LLCHCFSEWTQRQQKLRRQEEEEEKKAQLFAKHRQAQNQPHRIKKAVAAVVERQANPEWRGPNIEDVHAVDRARARCCFTEDISLLINNVLLCSQSARKATALHTHALLLYYCISVLRYYLLPELALLACATANADWPFPTLPYPRFCRLAQHACKTEGCDHEWDMVFPEGLLRQRGGGALDAGAPFPSSLENRNRATSSASLKLNFVKSGPALTFGRDYQSSALDCSVTLNIRPATKPARVWLLVSIPVGLPQINLKFSSHQPFQKSSPIS
jgi:hypothetical protein